MGKRGPKPKDPTRTDYNYNSDGTKRRHDLNTGKRIDPRRLERAEELFCGLGKEAVPLPETKIRKILMQEFGVSENQARVYLTVAKKRLAERYAAFDPEACVEQTDDMFLAAFAMATKNEDAHAMVAATHRRAELRGVFRQNSKVDVQVNGLGDLFGKQFSQEPSALLDQSPKELPATVEDPFLNDD